MIVKLSLAIIKRFVQRPCLLHSPDRTKLDFVQVFLSFANAFRRNSRVRVRYRGSAEVLQVKSRAMHNVTQQQQQQHQEKFFDSTSVRKNIKPR